MLLFCCISNKQGFIRAAPLKLESCWEGLEMTSKDWVRSEVRKGIRI